MNIGNCDFANSGKEFEIAEGDKLECPNCHCHSEMLVEVKPFPWKLIAIIAAAVVVLAGAGFGIYSLIGGGPEIDKIKLEPKSLALVVGQRDVVKATVVDKDGNEIKDAKVTYKWTVKDEKIVSVTQGGEVAALKKGKTAITVKIEGDDKNLRATCQVEVNEGQEPGPETEPEPQEVLITSLSVDNASISLKKGDTKQLHYQAAPEPNDESPIWVSSDPNVATVDANGVVTAVKKGQAEIIVKAQNVQSTPVKVTVKEGSDPQPEPRGVNLGYGIYEGPTSGGKANGIGGTIRFTRSYTIDLKKASGETVEVSAGDRMINVKMKDNRIIQGQLKRTDGSQRMIVIGG